MNSRHSEFLGTWWRRPLGSAAVGLLLLTFVFIGRSNASPILYTLTILPSPPPDGSPGASGRLGTLSFGGNNNEVILTFTFKADTTNVFSFFTCDNSGVCASGNENPTGGASLKITSVSTGTVLAQTNFLPSAGIFVSVDNTNEGVGFGSFGQSFPGEPVYPFAIFLPGEGLDRYDLTSNFNVGPDIFGFALSCVGLPPPNGSSICQVPLVLQTRAGDLRIDSACCFFFLPNGVFTAQIQPLTQFSAFTVRSDDGITAGHFDIHGHFTLGSGSDGIDPLGEVVNLQVGNYSVAIPSGSFIRNRKGSYVYEGTIAGVALEVRIAPVSTNSYAFEAEGNGANLTGTSSPVTIGLTIWDDAGTTTLTSEIE